ncbi:MAG: class II fructose-bisphosphate aldolase [Granulosicoccus sp.]|nr:class II fructose-bisphosphate aldolase [Granulosicoccus sp.]
MPLVNLSDVLQPALRNGYAVAGLVTLGWEDMRAFVAAAEAGNVAVILQAGPGCRAHTPLPVVGRMLTWLAEQASVPVVVHLDHGYSAEECRLAIECGFSSVMYDGSRKPLAQNIDETGEIAVMAHAAGVSCEGEIGFVGYSDGEESRGTVPEEAAQFASQTGIDAMAISVGNVHLQQAAQARLDETRIRAIQALTTVPLVIHGGSGVPPDQRLQLARTTSVCKFNIGTELRMAFGAALRAAVNEDPERFDRVAILGQTHEPVFRAALAVLHSMGCDATQGSSNSAAKR